MSDPMTNSDIEDVLSSIRRLVSQEAAPEDSLAVPVGPPPVEDVPPPPGRLVLTSALRVVPSVDASLFRAANSPEPDGTGWGEHGGVQPVGLSTFATERATLEQTIAELEAAVAVYAEDWEPDGSEVASSRGVKPAVAAESPAESPAGIGDAGAELSVIVEDQSAGSVAAPDADAEPARPDVTVQTVTEPVPELLPEAGLPFSGCAPEVLPDADQHRFASMRSASGLQPEAGQVRGPAQGEPSRPGLPTTSQDDVPMHDAALQDDGDETIEAGGAADDIRPEDPAEAVLDEEALRLLVGQIVREELQGDLGERITRNVRKFLRAEIARALASRGLD